MPEPIRRRSSLIEPVYSQAAPNGTIELGQLLVEFEHNDTLHRNTASFAMQFVPEDRLRFVYPIEDQRWSFSLGLFVQGNRYKKITLPERGVSFDAFCVASGGDHGGAVFTPTRTPLVVTQPSNAIVTAKIHLFNAPEFLAQKTTC
jgi:hypothetical protein